MVDPTRPDRARPDPQFRRPPHARAHAVVVTDARSAASAEISSRIRRYTVTMAFRMACFVGMVFVDGWLRWVLLGCAVFLPYIAVVLANQSDQRTASSRVEHGAPADAPQLTAGSPQGVAGGQVVEGSVVEDSVVEDSVVEDSPVGGGRDAGGPVEDHRGQVA